MIKIYKENGLPFYDQAWLRDRAYIARVLEDTLTQLLRDTNNAWVFHQIEAPCLIPEELISDEYKPRVEVDPENQYVVSGSERFGTEVNLVGIDPVYKTQDFYLRPETTAASYEYAKFLLEHQRFTPPTCVWQTAKSFRRENDQVSANIRLKEFYQQEFQCIHTEDTKKDYQELASKLLETLSKLLGTETRLVDSDRLPRYSQRTIDIEAKTDHKWIEICSISKRTDVPFEWNGRKLLNTEFAFGLDRCVAVMQGVV